jgi:hypothetical protein
MSLNLLSYFSEKLKRHSPKIFKWKFVIIYNNEVIELLT